MKLFSRRASGWFTASALALSVGCSGMSTDGVDSARQRGANVILPPASSPSVGGGQNGDTPSGTPGTTTTTGDGSTDGGAPGEGCTLTQGYWKNHPSKWPVNSLTLGSTSYDRAQLLAIFHTPTSGNGLVSLTHQLIAAKLNLAAGAAPAGITETVSQADALIGALVVPPHGTGWLEPGRTSALNDALTAFNEGRVGPGHCKDGPPSPPTVYPPVGNPPTGYPPPGDPVPPTSTPYPPTTVTPNPPPPVE